MKSCMRMAERRAARQLGQKASNQASKQGQLGQKESNQASKQAGEQEAGRQDRSCSNTHLGVDLAMATSIICGMAR